MSLTEFNPDRIPADQYTPEKGRYIAECFADGEALRDICSESGDWLPSMLIVKRWRAMFPAFDALMCEAAACRAENMAEDILIISDDVAQQAAHNRNRMAAREKLAGWMAPSAYGDRKQQDDAPRDDAPVYMLTDEQLLAIAAGKLAPAIDGEFKRLPGTGAHPPVERDPIAECEVSGTQKPAGTFGEGSVTTVEKFAEISGEHSVTISGESEKNRVEPGELGRGRLSFIGME